MARKLGLNAMLVAVLVCFAAVASAKDPEKKDVTIGVGGKSSLLYLPLVIAEQRGYFAKEGINVTVNDFTGGSQALQALIGKSVDGVTAGYEHTMTMQAKGQDVRAVIDLCRNSMVLAVRKSKADTIKTVADLKGAKIGITAPGSTSYYFVLYLLSKVGLSQADVSFIGVGAGAGSIAAIMQGELDALSAVDPVISRLEADKSATLLADTRSDEGTKAIYGGPVTAAVLFHRKDFIDANPETVQRLTNALLRALEWINASTPDEIVESVPKSYWLSDRALYLHAVTAAKACYSKTGKIEEAGVKASLNLMRFDPTIAAANIDQSKTYDNRFVTEAHRAIAGKK